MEQVRRKRIRLSASNYEAGWYFITICTENRENLLANISPIVGADDSVRPCAIFQQSIPELTPVGQITKNCLEQVSDAENGIRIDKYVIMPNHIHIIICLDEKMGGQSRPPLQRIVQRFKSITTRLCWKTGLQTLWQRSFYDHIIRNEQEYLRIWQYIDENPAKWTEDEYYVK